jgi:hypothetical protein
MSNVMTTIPRNHIERLANHADDPQMPPAVRLSAKVILGWLATLDLGEHYSLTEKRYKELDEAEDKLLALEAFGVDNWPGYEEAMKSLEDVEEQQDEDSNDIDGAL